MKKHHIARVRVLPFAESFYNQSRFRTSYTSHAIAVVFSFTLRAFLKLISILFSAKIVAKIWTLWADFRAADVESEIHSSSALSPAPGGRSDVSSTGLEKESCCTCSLAKTKGPLGTSEIHGLDFELSKNPIPHRWTLLDPCDPCCGCGSKNFWTRGNQLGPQTYN